MEGSLSTYDSIIPRYGAQWEKLDDNDALMQLHRKFWLQGIKNKLLCIHDAEEGNDDDIGPGCYLLDLEVPELGRSMLWIRNDYIRLYKCCNEYLESCRNEELPPSVIITGQPGIGKCLTF
jgi:hypothetical protein